MGNLIVADTCAVIAHFASVIGKDQALTSKAQAILRDAFDAPWPEYNAVVSAISLVEIYDSFCHSAEARSRIYYEVYTKLASRPSVNIRGVDGETLAAVATIAGSLSNHELHDKVILATAIVLRCPIVTSDHRIASWCRAQPGAPRVIC